MVLIARSHSIRLPTLSDYPCLYVSRNAIIVDDNDSKADQSASNKRIKLAVGKVGTSGGRMPGGSDDNKVQMDLVSEASLLTAGIWRFSDRTKSRLIISPIGKPLHQFKTYTELLMGIRDAIKGFFFNTYFTITC